MYTKAWVHIISISIVLFTTIYSGLCAFIKKLPKTPKSILVLSMIAALSLVFRRNIYLPFLGETVYPCENLEEKTPNGADTHVSISGIPPNANVIFWASEPSNEIISNPWDAYKTYSNSGVAKADNNGTATLRVRKPTGYKVPSGRELKPHIHYRFCQESGILSEVRSVNIDATN